MEKQGTWASRTQKHSKAGDGRPVDRGAWTAKTVKRPQQQPAHPQYANYWGPLMRKRHTMPHSAQPQHTNYWAPRTRKRHQQEHRPQRPTESSDPTQHAKGRTGDCPGPRKGATTRRNVTQGDGDTQRAILRVCRAQDKYINVALLCVGSRASPRLCLLMALQRHSSFKTVAHALYLRAKILSHFHASRSAEEQVLNIIKFRNIPRHGAL